MSKRYDNLEDALCKELEMLDKKYGSDSAEMTVQDVEKADKLYHALKSAETYHAMVDADMDEEDEESGRGYRNGRSYARRYARRRGSMGRFTSRDMGGYSGRYPMVPRYPMSYGDEPEWQY